jgi:hypothetical protein
LVLTIHRLSREKLKFGKGNDLIEEVLACLNMPYNDDYLHDVGIASQSLQPLPSNIAPNVKLTG